MEPTILQSTLRTLADKYRDDATDKLAALKSFINEAAWAVATATRDVAPDGLEPAAVRDLQEYVAEQIGEKLFGQMQGLERAEAEADDDAANSYGDHVNDQRRDARHAAE
ncbi:MAG: hypothetical protein WC869_11840 [Phycisphaerae bacterium]|jgi:hypothetical protein